MTKIKKQFKDTPVLMLVIIIATIAIVALSTCIAILVLNNAYMDTKYRHLEGKFREYQEITSLPEMLDKYVPYVLRFNPKLEKSKAVFIVHVIYENAHKYDVPLELAFRLPAYESEFHPMAHNKESGDYGLYQINGVEMDAHAKRAGLEKVTNPFDIEKNVKMGVCFLSHCLELSDNDWEEALAKYNTPRYWRPLGMAHAEKVLDERTAF